MSYVESIDVVVVRMGSEAFLTVLKHTADVCDIEFVCINEVEAGVCAVFVGQIVDGKHASGVKVQGDELFVFLVAFEFIYEPLPAFKAAFYNSRNLEDCPCNCYGCHYYHPVGSGTNVNYLYVVLRTKVILLLYLRSFFVSEGGRAFVFEIGFWYV